MNHASPASEPHRSRYHVTSPPPKLYAILTAFAKETKGREYRAHGGHPDNNAIRSVVTGAVGDLERGDADDIGRFLKKEGVLTDAPTGNVWRFDAEKADELIKRCLSSDPSIFRGTRSFVEMCERSSDPGPPPTTTLVLLRSSAVAAPPAFDWSSYEDDLLELHRTELVKKREEILDELASVEKELAIRVEKKRISDEIAALEATLAEKRRALESFNS